MRDEKLRRELGANARKTSLQFTEDNVRKMWVGLLEAR